MNQAASVTGRPPAGSTATAACCPVFNPFFMNTFAPQIPLIQPPSAQHCFLGPQATQVQPLTSIQPPAANQQQPAVIPQQQPTVSQQSAITAQTQRSAQQQRLQDQNPNQSNNISNININNISNNYNTSFAAHTLSLQHLLANRHPATDCMALAAAIASNLPQLQQLQHQSHLNHQQSSTSNASTTEATTTNQPSANSTSLSNNETVNLVRSPNTTAPTTSSNQVPILNFNSYTSAPQNLNVHALDAQQPSPPVTAHLNQSDANQQHQQQSHLTGGNQINSNVSGGTSRPLATNTLLDNIENQQHQLNSSYRRAPVAPITRPQQQQQNLPAPLSAQHIAQVTRATLSDEAINSLLNERFQTMLLNQLITSNHFAPALSSVSLPHQSHAPASQQLSGPQIPQTRSQFTLPNQVPVTSTQQAATSFATQQRLEQVSNQQQPQQQYQQPAPQPAGRVTQAPTDPVQSSISGIYQNQQPSHANSSTVSQQLSQAEQNVQAPPVSQPGQQAPTQQQQPPPQQQSQPIPSIPFYPAPPIDQVLALFANPVLLSQFFANVYLQSGNVRSEQHTHPNPSHHFHHHLHGSHHHHHHHHGPNGQGNGQDATIPVDSLAISESKPKGLNRAEIDSLTHYIHTDEKDSRTCVICLSKFELKSKIRPLSCNHAFHAKCVDKWLRANRTCPICRRDALKTYEGKIKRI